LAPSAVSARTSQLHGGASEAESIRREGQGSTRGLAVLARSGESDHISQFAIFNLQFAIFNLQYLRRDAGLAVFESDCKLQIAN
jgi:hypothetical protein